MTAPQQPLSGGFTHGHAGSTGVLLVNLGTPQAPTAAAVRRYLAEFLADRRVVEIPRLLWLPLLHGIILRTRPRRSAAKYAVIWTENGSPLAHWTRTQHDALQSWLGERGHRARVFHAMRYGQPAIGQVLDEMRTQGVRDVLVVPLYPQYAAATTGSTFDAVARWAMRARWVPQLRFLQPFHDNPGYIEALADSVRAHWAEHGRGRMLVVSFHGLPKRTLDLGDPYFCQCHKTARLLAQSLRLSENEYRVTFQSRLGRAQWLQPYTEPTLRQLAAEGHTGVDVICPGFVSDCLETLEEIAMEGRSTFLQAGGKVFHYIPAMNAQPAWIDALGQLVLTHLQGMEAPQVSAHELFAQQTRARKMGARA